MSAIIVKEASDQFHSNFQVGLRAHLPRYRIVNFGIMLKVQKLVKQRVATKMQVVMCVAIKFLLTFMQLMKWKGQGEGGCQGKNTIKTKRTLTQLKLGRGWTWQGKTQTWTRRPWIKLGKEHE